MRRLMPSKCVAGCVGHQIVAAGAVAGFTLAFAQRAFGEFDPTTPGTEIDASPDTQVPSASAVGTLVVSGSGAAPATLSIDGKDVGTLPFTGDLPAGTHEIVARSAHGLSATRKVVVSANGHTELELKVVENPSRLRVSTAIAGAIIRVDGIPYATHAFDGEVPAGKHTISVEQQGYVPSVINVDLNADELKVIDNIVLERATPVPARAPRSKRGVYTIVAADGLLAKPTNSFEVACPARGVGATCDSSLNMGGELDVRAGYSYGIFGIEGFAIGGTNVTVAHQSFPNDVTWQWPAPYAERASPFLGIARNERYLIYEPIGGGGIAGRVSTQGKAYRLSTAVGFGLAWREVIVNRKAEGIGDDGTSGILRRDTATLTSSGGNRAVGLLVWDADSQVGDTPGTRIFLGVHGQVELGTEPTIDLGVVGLGYDATTGAHAAAGGGSMTVRRSPAFFFGPRLGVVTGF